MLIIVESPAKAKTISKIVGSAHTVKASVGHIRSITQDSKSKDGRKLEIKGIDIEKDFSPIFEIDSGKKKVVAELRKLAKQYKGDILFATDSDREGEAISWHLAEVLGIKDKSTMKRLEFHEITKEAIEKAMQNPTVLNQDLVAAQQARQVLDKLVGFKLSPVLWAAMGNYSLSAGRVQTPALAILVKRETEIKAFNPEEYWEIKGGFGDNSTSNVNVEFTTSEAKKDFIEGETETEENIDLLAMKKSGGKQLPKVISSKSEVEKLIKTAVSNSTYNVVTVKDSQKKIRSKAPFTTSSLQQAASSSLGFAPKQTMGLAQKLYEGNAKGITGGLITYMRTDSTSLSGEAINKARNYIKSKYPEYLPEKPKFYSNKTRNAQEAHEAIRPTNSMLSPEQLHGKLDPQSLKLYTLIWKRTIACQMTDENKTIVTFELENITKDMFQGSVSWTTHLGWKAMYKGKQNELKSKETYKVGDSLDLQSLLCKQKFTRPPGRYSAASLIKQLEKLGIGRPSTYASIISTLQFRKYVEDKSKAMIPTALGMRIGELLIEKFPSVTSSEMTAKMENDLDKISNGEESYEKFLNDFWYPFSTDVNNKMGGIKEDVQKYRKVETTEDLPCPKCGGEMELKIGRFGEYYQCQEELENRKADEAKLGKKIKEKLTHIFPKNFRELEVAERKAEAEYGEKVKGLTCPKSKKDMVVRVSKSGLNPYIATATYTPKNGEAVISIKKLEENGWTQKTINEHIKEKGKGKKTWRGRGGRK